MVVSGDLALSKPTLVGGEDGRDQMSSGPDDVGIAADGIGAIDQVEDGIDTVEMIGLQRIDDVHGLTVVHLLGSETTCLIGIAADSCDDMCAASASDLHRVAADPAGRAHHHDVLTFGDPEHLNRPKRRDRRGWQGSGLVVGDAVGDTG